MIGTVEGRVGEAFTIEGYAQNFEVPIAAVQFSCDEQENWTTYEVHGADPDRNVNWAFSYTPETAGLHRLFVRAVAADGNVSHEAALACIEVGA